MIHLDTNFLIGLLVASSPTAGMVEWWLTAGDTLATSAICWTEFLNGPVAPLEVIRTEAVLQSQIIPSAKRKRLWQRICLTRPDDGAVLVLTV